jgi:hypothetical protein
MSGTFDAPGHAALCEFLVGKRKEVAALFASAAPTGCAAQDHLRAD